MNKLLKNKIAEKLDQLNQAIQKARDTVIDSEDENTWDYDHYSGLKTKLEKALNLLKNQILSDKRDEFGDLIITEKGILTLLDEYHEVNGEDDNYGK